MRLYDKQKAFEIKKFTKDLLAYHKPFYSDGNFVFNEKYLKGAINTPAGDHWRFINKTFYDTSIPDLPKIVADLTNEDNKLIPCYMEPALRGIGDFSLICQIFSYEIEDLEYTKLINVDYLKYIDIKKCLFKTTAAPTSPIIIYDVNNLDFVGLIMPIP